MLPGVSGKGIKLALEMAKGQGLVQTTVFCCIRQSAEDERRIMEWSLVPKQRCGDFVCSNETREWMLHYAAEEQRSVSIAAACMRRGPSSLG